ncbi:hypothetical protein [Gemmatimonas sp.]
MQTALCVTSVSGAVLVLVGTKGYHPGWITFLLTAVLVWFVA